MKKLQKNQTQIKQSTAKAFRMFIIIVWLQNYNYTYHNDDH